MRVLRVLVALALSVGIAATPCVAGPTITVGANVPAGQRLPVERIDHSAWNSLLNKYVDGQGMVNYRAWKASPSDTRLLEQYLLQLSTATLSSQTNQGVRLAFWINAYNAVTVHGILREYPTSSIRNHTAKLFGYNIWKDLQLIVGGKPYSLEQIEHEVLRKLGEPRIHFAIVCASIGCPRLLNEAYLPSKLDQQLTANAQAFFADPSKFRFDAQRQTVALSPILDWFADDFGASTAGLLQRIASWVPAPAKGLVSGGNTSVKYLDYDWNLNDQAPAGR
jgi:hypothetical protein